MKLYKIDDGEVVIYSFSKDDALDGVVTELDAREFVNSEIDAVIEGDGSQQLDLEQALYLVSELLRSRDAV
jgi:hypothetical protein